MEPELSDNDFKTAECEIVTSNSINLKAVEQTNHTAITEQVPACPRCQAAMVKRVAKKGQHQGKDFFGCSQFPKCRGVVNIAQPLKNTDPCFAYFPTFKASDAEANIFVFLLGFVHENPATR